MPVAPFLLLAGHSSDYSGFSAVVDVSDVVTAGEKTCAGGSRVFLQTVTLGSTDFLYTLHI